MYTDLSHYLLILALFFAFDLKNLRLFWIICYFFIVLTISFFSSVISYMYCDFSIYNVFTNSNINTPLLFQISATWSNHEGSLLLWCWLLTIFGFLFCFLLQPWHFASQSLKKQNWGKDCELKQTIWSTKLLEQKIKSGANSLCSFEYQINKSILNNLTQKPCFDLETKGGYPQSIDRGQNSQGLFSWLCSFFESISFLSKRAFMQSKSIRAISVLRSIEPKRGWCIYDVTRSFLIYICIMIFFFCFLLITSNPFFKMHFVCVNSVSELNPVLQDPILAIHPPCIYIGYVASGVAFSICCWKWIEFSTRYANADKKQQEHTKIYNTIPNLQKVQPIWSWTPIWIQMRIWISICWCFLTIGILLGSWWAYHELGWGGWWFWDPVENASLMPWLLATAAIHSVLTPRLHFVTLLSTNLTFLLCILGTFFVRSGLLASVHSFANDSSKGVFLLCFVTIIGIVLTFLCVQYNKNNANKQVQDQNGQFDQLVVDTNNLFRTLWQNGKIRSTTFRFPVSLKTSYDIETIPIPNRIALWELIPRVKTKIEQLFEIQNGFLLIITGIVLCGTAAPILFHLLYNRDVSTGAPFFNGTILPGLCCILLMLIYVHCFQLRYLPFLTTDWLKRFQFTASEKGGKHPTAGEPLGGQTLFRDYGRTFDRYFCVFLIVFGIWFHFIIFILFELSIFESFYACLCFILFCSILIASKYKPPFPNSYTLTKTNATPSRLSRITSPSRNSGYLGLNMKIAHIGIVVFIVGVLVSNRKKTQFTQIMGFGSEITNSNFVCCLRSVDNNIGPTYNSICGNLLVYKQPLLVPANSYLYQSKVDCYHEYEARTLTPFKRFSVMFPEKRFFLSNQDLSTTKVAIHTNLLSDIYTLIGTGSTETGWFITIMQLPYIFCIWIGFLFAAFAGFNSCWYLFKKPKCYWQ